MYQILQVDIHYKFNSGEHCLSLSRVQLFATPWTVARQSPLSMKFPRQEYWSGLSFPSWTLPDPGIEPESPAWQMDSLSLSHLGSNSACCLRWAMCLVAQLCLTFCDPVDCNRPGSSVHGDSPGKNTGVGCPSSRGSSQPRDQIQVSCTADGFFTIWATREACFLRYLGAILHQNIPKNEQNSPLLMMWQTSNPSQNIL